MIVQSPKEEKIIKLLEELCDENGVVTIDNINWNLTKIKEINFRNWEIGRFCTDGLNAEFINQNKQRAITIKQTEQTATNIHQCKHKAEMIAQNNHTAVHIYQENQNAKLIVQHGQRGRTAYEN